MIVTFLVPYDYVYMYTKGHVLGVCLLTVVT